MLIVGPLAEAVVNKLVSDQPHKFLRCQPEYVDRLAHNNLPALQYLTTVLLLYEYDRPTFRVNNYLDVMFPSISVGKYFYFCLVSCSVLDPDPV